MPKRIFTDEQEQYIRDNYLTKLYKDIASELGCETHQIRTWVHKHCPIRKIGHTNGSYFENIDTPLKAYFLGFIYADGTVSIKPIYRLSMGLQPQDKYILEKLNEELGGYGSFYHRNEEIHHINNLPTQTRGLDSLSVYSKEVVYNLINQGIVPNKTYSDVFPMIDNQYFFDYLRGYIDGDGCYYFSGHEKLNIEIDCHSKKNLEYIQSRLSDYDICTYIYEVKRSYKNGFGTLYSLRCTNESHCIKLLHYLYHEDGVFCLQRKYEKIKHLLGFAA